MAALQIRRRFFSRKPVPAGATQVEGIHAPDATTPTT
jgi:hypothetical protein